MAGAETLREVRLRPATPEDRFTIRRWLADPKVQSWWGNVASAEAEITLAMSSPSALCRIIECDGLAVGYAQAAEVGLWGQDRPQLAPGTWEIAYFMGPQDPGNAGLGPAALTLLVEEVFATTLALACCGVAPIRNEAAVRAYEKAGFRWQQIWRDALLGPAWLMLRERPR